MKKTVQKSPKVMKYQDMTNSGGLKNTLAVDANTSGKLVKGIKYIHDGKVVPETTYYVTVPTLEKVTDNTEYIGVGYQAGCVEVIAYIGENRKKTAAKNYTMKEW